MATPVSQTTDRNPRETHPTIYNGAHALTHQEMREEMKEDVAHHSSDGKAQQHALEPAACLGGALRDKRQDQSRNGADEPGCNSRGSPCMLHVTSFVC